MAVAAHPQQEAIWQLHQEGWTVVRIADDLKVCPRVVARVLREKGAVLRSGSAKKLGSEGVAWAERELSQGRSLKAVAADLGVSDTLIRFRVRALHGRRDSREPEENAGGDKGSHGGDIGRQAEGQFDV